MTSLPPALPVELSDSIIDYLADDWRALAVCALVCSVWRARAGHHLSRGVDLQICDPRAEAYRPEISDFMRMFCPGSPLCDLIVVLTIRGSWSPTYYSIETLPSDVDLGHLRSLHSLTLSNLYISSEAHFRALYTSSPMLRELTICDIFKGSYEGVAPRVRDESPCPPLRTVRMHFTRPRARLIDTLRDDLRSSAPSATLHTLDIHLPPAYVDGWEETLICLQEALHHLRIHLWPLRTNLGIVWHKPGLYSAIAGCKHLRRLVLHVSSGSQLPVSGFPALCSSIAQWLVSPTCLFAASLEEFTLCLCIRLQDLTPLSTETVALVGRALRQQAYPSLAHVRISIHDDRAGLPRRTSSATMYKERERKNLEELTAVLRAAQGNTARLDVYVVRSFRDWSRQGI